jgi:hypothetical protein
MTSIKHKPKVKDVLGKDEILRILKSKRITRAAKKAMLKLELAGENKTVIPVHTMLTIAGYDIYEVYVSFHPYYRIKPEKKIIELDKTLSDEQKQFLLAHIFAKVIIF